MGWRREIAYASIGLHETPSLFTCAVEGGRTAHVSISPLLWSIGPSVLGLANQGRPLLDKLPPSRTLLARVEAGAVREHGRTRKWVMLIAGGFAAIEQTWSSIPPPWNGEILLDNTHRTLPVVLGPSAVLSLIAYLIDAARANHKQVYLPTEITVRQSEYSQYPPQDLSRAGACASRVALLRTSGTIGNGALFNHFRRNLSIRHRRAISKPPSYLMVDAIYPLRQLAVKAVPFLLEADVVIDGYRFAVPTPLECVFAPKELLRRVKARVGSQCFAVERDPVFGTAIGIATPLGMSINVAELVTRKMT